MEGPFEFDDDGQVSEEEEEDAFLLFMDDDDDEEENAVGSHRDGCLSAVLLAIGVTAISAALPFLV